MTVIRPNSISGVSSITGNGGDISIFRADGTAGDLTINNIVGAAATFTGDLTINNIVGAAATFTGVVSYEDVTNVDSVGVITARSGISVTSGSIGINTTGGNEKLNTFGAIRVSGSSANFNAGLEGTLIDYDTSNRVSRVGHVNGASGSARSLAFLTGGSERSRISSDGHLGINTDFTGSQLWRSGKRLEIFGGTGNVTGELHLGANRGDGTQSVGSINFFDNTQDTSHKHVAVIEVDKAGSTSNKRGGDLIFYTKNDNVTGPTEKLRISSEGYLTKPQTPFFSVYGTGNNQTYNQGTDISFENVIHNVGSHFKMTSGTGQYQRFYAPVAGVYIFTFGMFPNSASNCRISLTVNGGVQTNPYISGCFTAWGTGVSVPMGSQMLKLSANDYVTVQVQIGTLSNTYDGHTGFQGFLLG